GIQADLKTMSALGVYGMSVITAVTAQNTCGVRDIEAVSPRLVKAQMEAVLSDIPCEAVKIGMLFSPENINVVVELLEKYAPRFVIVDPVLLSTHGDRLYKGEAITSLLRERLFPLSTLITPNTEEATALTGIPIQGEKEIRLAGASLLQTGCGAVLIKGGHLSGKEMCDTLFRPDKAPQRFTGEKIETVNTHGTGCSLSSAIASYLALGEGLEKAVARAKKFVYEGLRAGADVIVGKGHGPINHLFRPQPLQILTET
ncbi:MAG: bifunctional hydroxymethylpyrimidine kinase/phosphomethylpyrimidine kinase, partial [Porphyromonadaceae bacterium]|nr:bifunctional hydroxymethylpyrimidine kinase/phosphomethylpyrimidine kinase [Porphyromonadaceae bacterium]